MSEKRFHIIVAALGILAVIVFVFVNRTIKAERIYMNGPLSRKHAPLEGECSKCHSPWSGVENPSCLKCHEGKDDGRGIGMHAGTDEGAVDCLSCHFEHRGRFHKIELVEDSNCTRCHSGENHGDPVTAAAAGGATIYFPHAFHTDISEFSQYGCADCHGSGKDGAVKAVEFEHACAECHRIENHPDLAGDMDSCAECHPNGTLEKPKHDGKGVSSLFSHKKHSIAGDCAGCHLETLVEDDNKPVRDSGVKRCFGCHSERLVNTDCVTCHFFHPPK